MNRLLALSVLVAVVTARPEAGYSYDKPNNDNLNLDNSNLQPQASSVLNGGYQTGQYSSLSQNNPTYAYSGASNPSLTSNSAPSLGLLSGQSSSAGGLLINAGGANQYQSSGNAGGLLINAGGANQYQSGGSAGGLLINAGGANQYQSGGSAGGLLINTGANQYQSSGNAGGLLINSGSANQFQSSGNAGGLLLNSGGANQFQSVGNAGGLLITGAPSPKLGGALLVSTNGGGSIVRQINAPRFISQPQPLQPLVQKHIYVHVPPADLEEELQEQRIIQQSSQPTKHYKIIFIKAPSPPAPSQAQVLAAQQANEEKTLIYVLTKRPEQPDDITLPTSAPYQPSKPEVYFVKYQNNKQQINNSPGLVNGGGVIANTGVIAGPNSYQYRTEQTITSQSSTPLNTGKLSTSYGPPGHQPGSY